MLYAHPSQLVRDPYLPYNGDFRNPNNCEQDYAYAQQPATSQGQYMAASQTPWMCTDPSYNPHLAFMDACTTSINSSFSIFSSVSAKQNPFQSPGASLYLSPQTSFADRVGIARDKLMAATITGLGKLKEVLAAQAEVVDDLLQAAAVVLEHTDRPAGSHYSGGVLK